MTPQASDARAPRISATELLRRLSQTPCRPESSRYCVPEERSSATVAAAVALQSRRRWRAHDRIRRARPPVFAAIEQAPVRSVAEGEGRSRRLRDA